MTPRDLIAQLARHGLTAQLKLRLDGDNEPPAELHELIAKHRDDISIHLAGALGDTPPMCRLSEQLDPGAVWCRRCYRYQLRPCQPSDKTIEAN